MLGLHHLLLERHHGGADLVVGHEGLVARLTVVEALHEQVTLDRNALLFEALAHLQANDVADLVFRGGEAAGATASAPAGLVAAE
jgi:hypothetical protein